jgi:hypothetical protein
VFGDNDTQDEVPHLGQALSGKRARMVVLDSKHLKAFDSSSGMLMVSPFLPEGLKECEWCVFKKKFHSGALHGDRLRV